MTFWYYSCATILTQSVDPFGSRGLASRPNFSLSEAYPTLSSHDWAPWRSERVGRGSPRFRVMCLLFVRTLLSTTLSGVYLLSLSTSVADQQRQYTTPIWFRN